MVPPHYWNLCIYYPTRDFEESAGVTEYEWIELTCFMKNFFAECFGGPEACGLRLGVRADE